MQAVLSQQVSVVLTGEPCLCLSHHFFPGPLWAQQTIRTPGSRQKRTFSHSLWVVQMACKHKYLCKGYFFSNLYWKNKQIKYINRSTHKESALQHYIYFLAERFWQQTLFYAPVATAKIPFSTR